MSKNTGTSELINYFDLGVNGDVGIAGSLDINTIANATTDTDTFLVSDTGIIKYRTGAQLLSDIGAQAAGNYVTTDTSQAITANKSFTVGFSLASEGSGNQTSFFRNTSSIFSGSGGSNIFGFNNSNNIYFGKGLNNGGVLQWNNTTATRYYTLPDDDGTIALTSNIPANAVGGTGTTNYLPKFTGSTTIGNSIVYDDGAVGIGTLSATAINNASGIANLVVGNGGSSPQGITIYTNSSTYGGLNFADATTGGGAYAGYIKFDHTNDSMGFFIGNTPRVTIFSDGNTFIGTSPSNNGARLQVSGAIYSSDELYLDNGKYLRFRRSSGNLSIQTLGIPSGTDDVRLLTTGDFNVLNGSLTNLMTIKNGGNVGIGTVSPNAPLTVQSNGGGLAINLIGRNNAGIDESSILFSDFDSTTRNAAIQGTNSGLTFFYGPSTTLGMRLDGSGNVGIGTASPSANFILDINSTKASGASGMRLSTQSTSAGPIFVFNYTGSALTNWGIGAHQSTSGSLEFVSSNSAGGDPSTAGTSRMQITSSGNVLIGTTTDSGSKLRVEGGELRVTTSNSGVALYQSGGNGEIAAYNWGGGAYIPLVHVGSEHRFNTSTTERMRITSSGNVGIGTTSPATTLEVFGANVGEYLRVGGGTISSRSLTFSSFDVSGLSGVGHRLNVQNANGVLAFDIGGTERMRITSGGYLKASNDGVYLGGSFHEFLDNTSNGYALIVSNKAASPASTYIQDWRFTASTPNNSSARFWNCEDATANRAYMRSNGGLSNYQANDTNLSDERTKKDISPLESYWDKFKAIEIVKFKYKDQTHDDFNIGVIAQQVEAVAPEFVDVDGWDTKPELDEEGNEIVSEEEPLKSIYTADLYHATIKVLQEAMAKIEKLETEINKLKNT